MSDPNAATLAAFRKTGAYLTGHFRLTSGLHSSEYLQSAKVLQYPHYAEKFGRDIREALPAGEVDVVCAPAMGGLIIGHEVARAYGVRFIFTERDSEGKMTLRRGFGITPGEKVVIVEDVITTGGSTREVVELLRSMGAVVVAAASIIDRSGGAADVGVPRVALATLHVMTYDPSSCPLCAQGLEVVKPGSRPTA
ncbi:orotate phosphoribosyltransferase [Bryobacter aggregatus]|uniref:orotate phosphoribosyltransferase n=1 Tax=Bryobacter aggregatus TaxID=360054 RepID=UPI0004E2872C|nr:orotate phosphoribosyltransferase [Bryobacter aggregatus]